MAVFSVPNMKCGGRAKSATAALRRVDPAAEARVGLERREAAVKSAAGFEGEKLAA